MPRIPAPSSAPGGKLRKRIISGVLFAALIVAGIFVNPFTVLLITLALSLLCLSEFFRLFPVTKFFRVVAMMLTILLFMLVGLLTWFGSTGPHIPIWFPLVSLLFFHVFGHIAGESPGANNSMKRQTGILFIGFLWISQMLALSVFIRAHENGAWWLFFVVAVTAACDTGAYFIGKKWGRHPLAPRISPGKTVEGVVGGLICAIIAALLIGNFLNLKIPVRIFLGAVLAVAAILGDLFESGLKRKSGVKDSGTLIPGHGGLLDRLDSHLFTLPTLFIYLLFS